MTVRVEFQVYIDVPADEVDAMVERIGDAITECCRCEGELDLPEGVFCTIPLMTSTNHGELEVEP